MSILLVELWEKSLVIDQPIFEGVVFECVNNLHLFIETVGSFAGEGDQFECLEEVEEEEFTLLNEIEADLVVSSERNHIA